MPAYELSINIVGRDKASGPLRSIHAALSRIGEVAFGVTLAHTMERIASGFLGIASAAINATGQIQMMEVGLSSLISRELVQLSGGIKTVSDVLPEAEMRAKGVMDELARIAILSPYQLQAVNYTYRMAMAFGYTSKEATTFTKALMNTAAGVGADASMLERMAYNLAQVRLQGKVTALDIRQLALAGFDLRSVLKYVSQQMGYTIQDHLDFNKLIEEGKITWEDFTTNFAKYADEMFGGASERMARTLLGLKSTFNDVWVLTVPKIIGPAVEEVTDRLNKLLNIFITLRDDPAVTEWAEKIRVKVAELVGPFDVFISTLGEFLDLHGFEYFGDGVRLAISKAFGSETLARIDGFMKILAGIGVVARFAFGSLGKVLSFIGTIKLPPAVTKDLQEGLGNLFKFLATYGPPVLEIVGGFVSRLFGIATPSVKGGLTTLSGGFVSLTETLLLKGPEMVKWLDDFLLKITNEWIPAAKNFVINLKQDVSGALGTVGTVIRALVAPALGLLTGGLLTAGVIAVLPFALKVARLATTLQQAASALGGWGPLLAGFRQVAVMAFAPLTPALPVILGVVAAIAALALVVTSVVIAFQTNFGGVRDILTNLGGTIMETLKPAFDRLLQALQPLFAAFQNLWVALQPIFQLIGALATYIFTLAAAIVTGLIDGIVRALTGIVMIVTSVINTIATIIQSIIQIFVGLFNVIKGIVTGDGNLVKQGFIQIATGIWNILVAMWNNVIGLFKGIFATIIGFVGGFVEGIINFFVNLFDRLVGHSIIPDGMKAIFNSIKDWFKKVTDHVKGLVNTFLNLGKDIIDGLKEGAKSAWQRFLSWFQGIINLLPDVVKKILGISSPSKVMFRLGVDTIRGAEAGVRYRTPALASATAAAANRMTSTFNSITQRNEFNVRDSLDAELIARRTGQFLLEMTE